MSGTDQTSDANTLRLLHALQVHQEELTRQNEELLEARADLADSLRRYIDLYESAPVGLLTLDRQGTIYQINQRGRELLGADHAALIGSSLLRSVAPASREALSRSFAIDPPGAGRHDLDLTLDIDPPRTLRAEVMINPRGADSLLLALTDVSAERRQQAARVEQAVVDAARRRRAVVPGHWSQELRTASNAVLGFSALLQMDEAIRQSSTALRQLGHIAAAGRQLLAMADEAQAAADAEAGAVEVPAPAQPTRPGA
jgi:PAS domain-containing protein